MLIAIAVDKGAVGTLADAQRFVAEKMAKVQPAVAKVCNGQSLGVASPGTSAQWGLAEALAIPKPDYTTAAKPTAQDLPHPPW